MSEKKNNSIQRPPVVTVMGHIDHGKSTLLDYIRKTKITETEAGGITQHISAYEVEHTTEAGEKRAITFLDTPGHEAFQHLRSRGSSVADLAILVVAADDGVKPQTLQALKAIEETGIPFLVAITKIDKSNADIEHAKASLLEHGVYLEGLGGDISFMPISSKTGEGVPALLDLLLLAADMEELHGDPSVPATGMVIESHCDPKRGISAVLVITDGTLTTGQYIVAGEAYAPLRIVENFLGKSIGQATFSSPIMVVGFSETPVAGSPFTIVETKKAAVEAVRKNAAELKREVVLHANQEEVEESSIFTLPVIIKSDVEGSIEAIKHELKKCEDENTVIQVVHGSVGTVAEGDIKDAAGGSKTLVIGFNVGVDAAAAELAERLEIEIAQFNIIYDLADWLPKAIAARRPKVRKEVELGRAKMLKCFSFTKKLQTVGCRVEHGTLTKKDKIILRHGDEELGRGTILSLKSGMSESNSISEGNDCGAQISIELDAEPKFGNEIVAYKTSVE